MQILKLLLLLALFISCSKPSEPEFSFTGDWMGTWTPIGPPASAAITIWVNEDGSASGSGEISYQVYSGNPDVRETEYIALTLVIDGYGYISGTGSWHTRGDSTLTGEVTGRFLSETAYGYFQVTIHESQQPDTISWNAKKIIH